MKAETEKMVARQSKAVASASTDIRFKKESDVQFEDGRPETVGLSELAGKADSSPQARKIAQLQAMVDGSAVGTVQGKGLGEELLQGKFETIQKQPEEEEEMLQGKFEAIQRQGAEEEEELMQGKFESLQRVEEEELMQGKFQPLEKQKNNTGLPDNLKSGMEHLSGQSLDHVKVHYNSSKPAAVKAHAYAQGSEIHLASGQDKHLPHELGHVVQQMEGRVQPTTSVAGLAVNDNTGLEKEATRLGDRAMQMQEKKGD